VYPFRRFPAAPYAVLVGAAKKSISSNRGLAVILLCGGFYALYQLQAVFTGWTLPGRTNVFPTLADFLGAVIVFRVARQARVRRLRVAWTLIGLGLLSWWVADAVVAWSVMFLNIAPASPHFTDIFYILFYPLVTGALFIYPARTPSRAESQRQVLDVGLATIVVGLLVWFFLVTPALEREPASFATTLTDFAYPLGQMMLVWAIFHTLFHPLLLEAGYALRWLLVAVALLLVSDLASSFVLGRAASVAGIWDAVWFYGTLMVGVAATRQAKLLRKTEARILGTVAEGSTGFGRPSRTVELRLAYVALITVVLLMVILTATARPNLPNLGLYVGIDAAVVVLFIRLTLALRENSTLTGKLWELSGALERRVAERTSDLTGEMEKVRSLGAQLMSANEDLRRADRQKSEFIANVSHEFRTPLTSILGYTELLLISDGEPDPMLLRESLTTINANGKRLLHLVNELLDVSTQQEGRFEVVCRPCDLSGIIQSTIDQMGPLSQRLEMEIPAISPQVSADAPRVSQVLLSFLSNAAKFTPAEGAIRIAVLMPGEQLPGLAELPGDRLMVAVTDGGRGLEPGESELLFTRFYRTELARRDAMQGSGLGLSIAKEIITAHGGDIGVQSEPGAGCTFWFTLPYLPPDVTASAVARQGH
jgi:signal transduction histidine kinase